MSSKHSRAKPKPTKPKKKLTPQERKQLKKFRKWQRRIQRGNNPKPPKEINITQNELQNQPSKTKRTSNPQRFHTSDLQTSNSNVTSWKSLASSSENIIQIQSSKTKTHAQTTDSPKISVEPQHKLLVHGYTRIVFKTQNIDHIKQLIHEFYHKNVIVYQTQKDDPSIEEYTGIAVGGSGGGQHKYISVDHKLLTTLRVGDLTLYNQDGVSILGYQFDGDESMKYITMGYPPDGVRYQRDIKLVTRSKEYCNGVEIYYGGAHDGIRGIRFVTNYERGIMVGFDSQSGVKWKSTRLMLPHKQYGIIGFQGRSGWLLDQICFVFAPQ